MANKDLLLSNDHLSADTHAWIAKRFDNPVTRGRDPDEVHILMSTSDDPGDLVPPDLRACLLHGHMRGFEYIRFTADGSIEPGLTVFQTIPA